MAITAPPTPATPPAVPDRSNRTTFPGAMNTFFTWQVGDMVTDMEALADNAYNNATEAQTYATSASGSATTATTKASEALSSANAAAASASSAINAPGTSSTSTTSLTIGTGSKSLTIQTGKAYAVGQNVTIARTSSPANAMSGPITSYDSGTGALVVGVTYTTGSGTYTDWTVALGVLQFTTSVSSPPGATTQTAILFGGF